MSVTKVTGMMQTSTKGGDIPSASPTVIDSDGDYFDLTGTTSFSVFTVTAGRRFTIQFDGVLTMTHHATTLDLPGGANITTAAGDVAEFFATGTNTVQCVNYTKADGTAVVAAGGFTLGTETATTSGTTFNFGSIPSGTTLIIINFNGVSLDGSAALQVQIGDASGIETSGYVSSSGTLDDDDTITHSSTTASFIIRTLHSYAVVNMRMVLSLTNSSAFTWHSFHGGAANNNESTIGGGTKSLSAELTQLQILDNGSDNFDAGSINISYQ